MNKHGQGQHKSPKRKPPSKQAKTRNSESYQMLRLKTLDLQADKFFRVYKDEECFQDLTSLEKDGK